MLSEVPPMPKSSEERFFQKLLRSSDFREFALALKKLTGLSTALNTPGVGLTQPGVPGDSGNPLCAMIRNSPEGARKCEECDRLHHARAGAAGLPLLYTCHAGFRDMAIPIQVRGRHVATISCGQALPESPSEKAFYRIAKRLHWLKIPRDRLRKAYATAPWLPRHNLLDIARLIELFSRKMCEDAWRIHELEAHLERPQIRKARAFIESQFRNPDLCLAQAAAFVGISKSHFSHVFHKETGISFIACLQARRIKEARLLLSSTEKNITEICFVCGFNSLTHFNRVFHQYAKTSPTQFRKSLILAAQPGTQHDSNDTVHETTLKPYSWHGSK